MNNDFSNGNGIHGFLQKCWIKNTKQWCWSWCISVSLISPWGLHFFVVYPLIGQQLKWLNWKRMWPFDGRGAQGLRYGSIMFLGRWLWQVVGWEKPLDFILSDSGRSLRINKEVDFHFWSLMKTYQGNFCGFSERRMSKNVMVYHSFPNWNGML